MIKNGLSILLASLLVAVLSPPPAAANAEEPRPEPELPDAEMARKWLPPGQSEPSPTPSIPDLSTLESLAAPSLPPSPTPLSVTIIEPRPVTAARGETIVTRPGRPSVFRKDIPVKRYDPRRKSLGYSLLERTYRSVYRELLGVPLATPPPPPPPPPPPSPTPEGYKTPAPPPSPPPSPSPTPEYCAAPLEISEVEDLEIFPTRAGDSSGWVWTVVRAASPADGRYGFIYDSQNVAELRPAFPLQPVAIRISSNNEDVSIEEGDYLKIIYDEDEEIKVYPPALSGAIDVYYYVGEDGSTYSDRWLCFRAKLKPTPSPPPTQTPSPTPEGYKTPTPSITPTPSATPTLTATPPPSPIPESGSVSAAVSGTDDETPDFLVSGPALSPAGGGQMFSVAADSRYIYGGNEDGDIYVWDRQTLGHIETISAPGGMILTVHADPGPDGFLYAAGTGNKLYVWRKGEDFTYRVSLGIGQQTIEAVFSDDEFIYAADTDGYVYVWDRETLLLHQRLERTEGLLASIRSDRDRLYAGTGGLDDALYVWEKPGFGLYRILREPRDDVNSIHVGADRIYAAAARDIYVWNRSDLSSLGVITGAGWGMNAVSACDGYIYGANENGRIYIWSKPDHRPAGEIAVSDQSVLWVFADGDLLLAAGRDGRVHAWRIGSGDSVSDAIEHLGRYGISVAASPAPAGEPAPSPRLSLPEPTPRAVELTEGPRTGRYDPVRKTLGYGLIQRTYRSVYQDFFGVLLTTPTPPPTPIPTPTPERIPTPEPEPGEENVVINEINWGGTVARPDDGEWIELHNYGGDSVNLQGWTIENQTAPWTITITRELTISAGGFVVLARGFDSPGNADFIYGQDRALGDVGARLVLKDAAGEERDIVDSAREWFAGGTAVSMERIDPAGNGSNSLNWGNADPDANYPGETGLNSGTPRRRNSVAEGAAAPAAAPDGLVAAAPDEGQPGREASSGPVDTAVVLAARPDASPVLTLEDYAYWIDFEAGRYFKLLEADYGDLHPRSPQLDYLPNTAFIYLATGWSPARDYFRRHLLAMVRDEEFDWGGEDSLFAVADTAEAYLAMAAEGVFTSSERREIEERLRRLAADGPAVSGDSPAVVGLRAAVDYIVGGKEGKGTSGASYDILSYDRTWSPPENSRHFSSHYVREMLRVALYRNRMTIPDLDDDGVSWKENFARQVRWILAVFPHNGFHPAWGEEPYLNRIGHYLSPLVAATSILDDEDPENVRLARQAKWLAQRMFLYGSRRGTGGTVEGEYGYHAAQWGPFPILLNPVHLWWFWNEDLPPLRPDRADLPGGVISRPVRAPDTAREAGDSLTGSLSEITDKVVHRSGWEDDSIFVMLDLGWPALRGAEEYGFANSLLSLGFGPEEFLAGQVTGEGSFPARSSLVEGMAAYRPARVEAWEDNDAYSRSVTRVEDGKDVWTREVIVRKRGLNEVEVIDTFNFPALVRWNLAGEADWTDEAAVFEIGGTRLQVAWPDAGGVSLTRFDPDPGEGWSYSGGPVTSLELSPGGTGTLRTVFRGLEASPPPSPPAVPEE